MLRIVLPIILFLSLRFTQTTTEVRIGSQTWKARNLEVTSFANGDKITEAQSKEAWLQAGIDKKPAWCYYNGDAANAKTYGLLYNWYAVSDPRGLAPAGWHVPQKEEWSEAFQTLGGNDVAGGKLKSTTLWQPVSGQDRNGTNDVGFSCTPAGMRFEADGGFDFMGTASHYWTATQHNSESAQQYVIGISSSVMIGPAKFNTGYSVRAVKD